MIENSINESLTLFKKYLSNCVNVHKKTTYKKELLLSFSSTKKQIGFILSGKASIIKTDIDGNTVIIKELKENDIFSNLFFQDSIDEIFIISDTKTEVMFIDYYVILKDCNQGCAFHNQLVLTLFDLLIQDNKQQNEKIELLSKRTVREKFLYFLTKRMDDNHIFYVTTSYKAISEYIYVDRSNLMREITKMEQEGIIKKEKKKIIYLK